MSVVVANNWSLQPQCAVTINRSDPIGSRVRYACLLGTNLYDVVSGIPGTPQNSPTAVVRQNWIGSGFVTASSQGIILPSKNLINGSILSVTFYINITTTSVDGVYYSFNGTNYNAILGKLSSRLAYDAKTSPSYQCYTALPIGIYHIIAIHGIVNNPILYINGVRQTGQSSGYNWGMPAAGNHSIGFRYNGSSLRYMTGEMSTLYVIEGPITDSEARMIYENHWRVFSPRKA